MILFLTKGDRVVASSRQRVWNVADRLHKRYGIDHRVLHSISYSLWSFSPKRFKLFARVVAALAQRPRTVFVHKALFPLDVVVVIIVFSLLFRRRLVFDMDDAEWEHSWLQTMFLTRWSDTVVCGSHVIQQWADTYAKKTVVVPTVVDTEEYQKHAVVHTAQETLTVGWVGAGNGYFRTGHFAFLPEVFGALADRGVRIRFVLIGAQHNDKLKQHFAGERWESVFVDTLDWEKPGAVAEALKEYAIDVGVAPMVATPFSIAKAGFKIIEYMAVGLPVVVSPIGEQRQIARHGVEGYHATTQGEWVDALEKLAVAGAREEMGAAGLQRAAEEYSYTAIIPRIADILHIQKP